MGLDIKTEYSTCTKALSMSEIAQLLQNTLKWMTKTRISRYTPSTHTVSAFTLNISLHTLSRMDPEAPLQNKG